MNHDIKKLILILTLASALSSCGDIKETLGMHENLDSMSGTTQEMNDTTQDMNQTTQEMSQDVKETSAISKQLYETIFMQYLQMRPEAALGVRQEQITYLNDPQKEDDFWTKLIYGDAYFVGFEFGLSTFYGEDDQDYQLELIRSASSELFKHLKKFEDQYDPKHLNPFFIALPGTGIDAKLLAKLDSLKLKPSKKGYNAMVSHMALSATVRLKHKSQIIIQKQAQKYGLPYQKLSMLDVLKKGMNRVVERRAQDPSFDEFDSHDMTGVADGFNMSKRLIELRINTLTAMALAYSVDPKKVPAQVFISGAPVPAMANVYQFTDFGNRREALRYLRLASDDKKFLTETLGLSIAIHPSVKAAISSMVFPPEKADLGDNAAEMYAEFQQLAKDIIK